MTVRDHGGRQFGYESDRFVAYWWFVGWDCLSLGFHVCLSAPNVELHLPFGFIRIGCPSSPGEATLRIDVDELIAAIESRGQHADDH